MAKTTQTTVDKNLPEAAASVTARVVTSNGFPLLFTLRDTTGVELLRKFEEFEKVILAKGWKPEIVKANGQKMFGNFGGSSRSQNGHNTSASSVQQSSQQARSSVQSAEQTTCAKCGAPAIRKMGKRKDDSTWEGVFCSTGDENHKMWLS